MKQAQLHTVTIDEYLRDELTAEEKHEYIAGQVYAMVGTSRRHNLIASNLLVAFREYVKSPCQVYMADIKLHIRAKNLFYYPDLMVGCDPEDNHEYYLERPQVIVEVLSESTELIDRREKWLAYQTIPTLREYLMVHQSDRRAELYLRDDLGSPWWKRDHGPEDKLELPTLGLAIPLVTIYRDVD